METLTNLKESLVLGTHLTVDDAVAQLTEGLGLSDDQVFEKFPHLEEFDGEIEFRSLGDIAVIGIKDGKYNFTYWINSDGSVNETEMQVS